MEKLLIASFMSFMLLSACGPKSPQPASPADSPAQPVTADAGGDDFSTPEGTVKVFIQACAGKDVDLLNRSFSINAEKEFSSIVQKNPTEELLDDLKAMFEGATPGETSMGSDGATAEVKVNLAQGDETLHLAKEGDGWKITGF